MVDISDFFTCSLKMLREHKCLFIPAIISVFVPMLAIMLLMNITGVTPMIREVTMLKQVYDQQQAYYLMQPTAAQSFMSFLEQHGFGTERFTVLLTLRNIELTCVVAVVAAVLALISLCMLYAMTSMAVRRQRMNARAVFRSTMAIMPRVLGFKLAMLGLLLVPLALVGGMVTLLFAVNPLVGIFLGFFFLFIFLIYSIVLGVMAIFAIPALCLDRLGPVKSIAHSFRTAKFDLKTALILFAIIYAIRYAVNSTIQQPLTSSFFDMMAGQGALNTLGHIIFFGVFMLITSATLAFETMFLFTSYIGVCPCKQCKIH
jgi:hypothetical protein